ncbi:MAG TPA: class IV adenylate cyclase [Vicinamibacterales bacterium]
MAVEREIKLRFPSPEAARQAVQGLGAVPLRPRRLQDDVLFDASDGRLQQAGCALRVRRDGDRGAVTFKGPVVASAMKTREEIETAVDQPEAVERLFTALGFSPQFRYQKFREEFSIPGVVLAVDETPVGTFIELEGEEAAIADAAARLGRSPADYVLASYRALFLEHVRQHGGGPHMLFEGA